VRLSHDEDEAGRIGGLGADLCDPPKEESQPPLPIAMVTYSLQVVVVSLAMTPEVVGQIQDGLEEHPLLGEQERDQEPAHSSVAVEKGVDGLELCVSEADLDQ